MPPVKKDFDLTDRGWVDLYVKKCESIMKEFTNYVYALQHHCVEERNRSEKLDRDYKNLQTKVAKLNKEQEENSKKHYDKNTFRTPEDRRSTNNISVDINAKNAENDPDRTTISEGSPAFLNMAMDSEQLQLETTCILSPAQHHQELITASEQLSSPKNSSTALDSIASIFQHNTSPTCKLKSNNENKSALDFLKARGRVGKILLNETRQPKLREHNCATIEQDVASEYSNNEGKLQAKRSDWLGKDTKSEERKAALKRAFTGLDDIQRKRALLSLNKSGERKLKQSRLTQIVPRKLKNESTSISPEDTTDAQPVSYSPTTPIFTRKNQFPFPSFSSDTDDIFHFSSDDDDDRPSKKDGDAIKEIVPKPVDATFLKPLTRESEKSESVLAITPTAPPIICLDESQYNEPEDEKGLKQKSNIKDETKANLKNASTNANKKKRTTKERLPTELAAAMLAEWEEEVENKEEDEAVENPLNKSECQTSALETKSRLSQLSIGKISIKDYFNIDCDECQKYVDFMSNNMNLADIEQHLRRCTLHRPPKDCLPVTPPDYWNPLMPSFSESDPRNKTLLEDPYLRPKRK